MSAAIQLPLFGEGRGAHVDGSYRYLLWRTWNPARPSLLWIMLNPSTADARHDDPTMRRVVGFTRRWGIAGGVHVVNLFAYRSASPGDLTGADDPVGPGNDTAISEAILRATAPPGLGMAVAAWGAVTPKLRSRIGQVLPLLDGVALLCTGTTKHGDPRHPLYVPSSAPLVLYTPTPEPKP